MMAVRHSQLSIIALIRYTVFLLFFGGNYSGAQTTCVLFLGSFLGIAYQGSEARAQSGGYDVDRLQVAPSASDGLTLYLPQTPGHLRWSLGAGFGYVASPLSSELRTPEGGTFEVVGGHLAGQLSFNLGLRDNWELHATLTGNAAQGGDDPQDLGLTLPMATSGGVGDLRLGAKRRLLSEESKLGLAINASISLPTGSQGAFAGDGGVGAQTSLIASYPVGPVLLAGQGGFVYRPDNRFALLQVGSEVFLRGGAHLPVGEKLRLMVEIDSRTDLHENRVLTQSGTPVEALVGAKASIGSGLTVGGFAGVGVMNASGEPEARALLSIRWTSQVKPRETSGAYAETDTKEESLVSTVDTKPVEDDIAPLLPEDSIAGKAAADKAAADKAAADKAAADKAAADNTATPPTSVTKTTALGFDEAKAQMPGAFVFTVGNSDVEDEPAIVLNKLAALLAAHPEVRKIELRGHASAEGTPSFNKSLSMKRARMVKKYLVSKGISPSRLKTVGAGENEPIGDNDTEDGRKQNRRVEIRVLRVK